MWSGLPSLAGYVEPKEREGIRIMSEFEVFISFSNFVKWFLEFFFFWQFFLIVKQKNLINN